MLDIGENKVQEALSKIEATKSLGARYHLIGHLQSNKAKHAVANFDLIHSVDSVRLANELNRHAAAIGKIQDVLLQVSVSGEESKSGFDPEPLRHDLAQLLETCPSLVFRGFMTMAPLSENPEDARPHFKNLRLLAKDLAAMAGKHSNFLPGDLSMGMTGDFEVAIEEGATLVRIGSALFGHR
jgi:pyridoxal phosphate enzyme (YggS family)